MKSSEGLNDKRPIDEALPADVWAEGLGRFAAYQRFPRYTWPWFRRRAYVLWPFAIANGIFFGVWHATSMTTWADAFPLGSRGVLASILTVSIGPLMALLVRYRRLPYRWEAGLIVAALAAGVLISHVLQQWVADYHDMLMNRHCCGSMIATETVHNVSQTIGTLMGKLPYWLGLFLFGGGWELRSYFTEKRLLAEHMRRQDLSALRRNKAETDLRLAVLQAQIEPHFLFNTLASIRSLAASDPQRADATIQALSGYLRTTLPKFRDIALHGATLGEQIDICASYLELMKIRLGERLRIVIDVSNDLRTKEFPPLLLIPLVENAIKHGVEPDGGPVTVCIRARLIDALAGRQLQVYVEDNGAGLTETVGAGVGLANVRAQLEHRFGAAASLVVENVSGPQGAGRGVRASINVPEKSA
jgi:signal transduction histidine kinase